MWEGKPGTITLPTIQQASNNHHNHSHTPPGSSTTTGKQHNSEINSTFWNFSPPPFWVQQRDKHEKQTLTQHTNSAPATGSFPSPREPLVGWTSAPPHCPAPPTEPTPLSGTIFSFPLTAGYKPQLSRVPAVTKTAAAIEVTPSNLWPIPRYYTLAVEE